MHYFALLGLNIIYLIIMNTATDRVDYSVSMIFWFGAVIFFLEDARSYPRKYTLNWKRLEEFYLILRISFVENKFQSFSFCLFYFGHFALFLVQKKIFPEEVIDFDEPIVLPFLFLDRGPQICSST